MLSPTEALLTAALGLTTTCYCKHSDFSVDQSRFDLWLLNPSNRDATQSHRL